MELIDVLQYNEHVHIVYVTATGSKPIIGHWKSIFRSVVYGVDWCITIQWACSYYLRDSNRIQTHLVCKQTLIQVVVVQMVRMFYCLWVRILLLSFKLQILRLFRARSSLIFRQLWSVDSLWNGHVHTVMFILYSWLFISKWRVPNK